MENKANEKKFIQIFEDFLEIKDKVLREKVEVFKHTATHENSDKVEYLIGLDDGKLPRYNHYTPVSSDSTVDDIVTYIRFNYTELCKAEYKIVIAKDVFLNMTFYTEKKSFWDGEKFDLIANAKLFEIQDDGDAYILKILNELINKGKIPRDSSIIGLPIFPNY